MSMMFYLGYNNKVYLFSDTRVSTKIKDQHYYINDSAEKAKMFGDKVIFGMGRLEAINDIFDSLPSKNMQISDVQLLAKENFEKYKCDELVLYTLEIDNYGRYVIHTMASEDDFDITTDIIRNRDIGGAGAHSDKALEYIYEHITSGKHVHHYSYIKDAYAHVADEIVGGKCIIFEVEAVDPLHVTISRYEHVLTDRKELRRYPFYADPNGNAKFKKVKITDEANTMLMDSETRKFYMNNWDIEGVGKLDAQHIQTGTVTAEDGFINRLTVNALKTLDQSDTIGDSVDYVTVKDKHVKLQTGTITDRQHAKNSNNELLYWSDATKKQITTNVTGFPVYELEYEPVDKMAIELIGEGMSSHPRITMGAGDGATETSGKSITEKIDGSYDTYYYSSNYGRERSLRLKDDEVLLKSENSKIHMQAKNYEIEAEDGAVKITLSNGSYFELTSSGDINAHAINNIKMTADAKVQFNANEYEFK